MKSHTYYGTLTRVLKTQFRKTPMKKIMALCQESRLTDDQTAYVLAMARRAKREEARA